MAVKTFYLKNAVPTGATLHRSLQDGGSAPTAATTTTGWVAATNAVAQSCLQAGGSEVSRTAGTWGTTLQPSAAPSQTVGDCWRSENTLTGDFANTAWSITFQVRSVTAAYAGRFKLAVRLWRSANANGTGAVELTAGRVASSATTAALTTSADTAVTVSVSPGAETFTAEYLFMQVGLEITTVGTGTTQDIDFRVGSTATLVTPNFTWAQTLTPTLHTNSNSFYVPTVAPGAVTLTPPLLSNSNAFYGPTVAAAGGAQALTPGLFNSGSNAFFAPSVAPGAVTLTPALFGSASNAIYGPTVTRGAVTLLPGLAGNSPTFYGPTVTRGTVTLAPALFSSGTNAFFAPAMTRGLVTLTPGLLSNSPSFFGAVVAQDGGSQFLTPARFDNGASFYAPTVITSYTLSPALLSNSPSFSTPILSRGTVTLAPSLQDNANSFPAPTVQPGAVLLAQDSTEAAWNVFFSALLTQTSARATTPGTKIVTVPAYPNLVLVPRIEQAMVLAYVNVATVPRIEQAVAPEYPIRLSVPIED